MKAYKRAIIFIVIFLHTLILIGCGGGGGGGGGNNDRGTDKPAINHNEHGSPAIYDKTYDKEKVLQKHPGSITDNKMSGYIYNKLYIQLHIHLGDSVTETSNNLLVKKSFNEWLSDKTSLVFNNSTIDEKVTFSKWLVEFPYASEDEINNLISILENNIEVYNVTHPAQILPEYESKDNVNKLKRIRYNFNYREDTSIFDYPKQYTNSGSWYFRHLGITDLDDTYLKNNKINIGVLDTSIHLNHDDIDCIKNKVDCSRISRTHNTENETGMYSHGTAVAGIISAATIDNGVGLRGITDSKLHFTSVYSTNEHPSNNDIITMLDKLIIERKVSIINLSFSNFEYDYISAKYSDTASLSEYLNNNQYYIKFIKESRDIRNYIKTHKNTLFVLSAGNESIDAKYENGVYHYNKNKIYEELPNLIVVGSNGQDDILHGYSNYGESVNITAPSGIATLACQDRNGISKYVASEDKSKYGFSKYNFNGSEILIRPEPTQCNTLNEVANGTSFSAPMVSGVAALIWNLEPNIQAHTIKDLLIDNGTSTNATHRWGGKNRTFPSHLPGDRYIPILNAYASYHLTLDNLTYDASIYSISTIPKKPVISTEITINTIINNSNYGYLEVVFTNKTPQRMEKISDVLYRAKKTFDTSGVKHFTVNSYSSKGRLLDAKTSQLEVSEYKLDEAPKFNSPSLPKSIEVNAKTHFAGNISDDNGLYHIQMDVEKNGASTIKFEEIISGTTKNLNNYYFLPTEAGDYKVTLTITDNANQVSSSHFYVEVKEPFIFNGGIFIEPSAWGTKLSWNAATPTVTSYDLFRSNNIASLGDIIYSGLSTNTNDILLGRVEKDTILYYVVQACNGEICINSKQDYLEW